MQTFSFLKYIKPTWYFNLIPQDEPVCASCYYSGDNIKIYNETKTIIFKDDNYKSKKAKDMDIGFQAWHKGILLEFDRKEHGKIDVKVSIEDNYRFIRKYYKRVWSIYILSLRLISFHNPFKEFSAFYKAENFPKRDLFHPYMEYLEYQSFDSQLTKKARVSVIIPTLNRYEYLRDVLSDLEKQTIKADEVIIVDQSEIPDKTFYDPFKLPIKLIFQSGKGQWLARNAAIGVASNGYLLFFDDDSRVESDWIEQHLKCIDFFDADICAGVSISKVGARVPENYAFFRWADQFDSGNAMVKREVFEKIGLFDRQYDRMRMGDGEFGLRAYLNGFKSISSPYAKRLHLKVEKGGLRQMGSWDAFRPKRFFSPRPVPSVLYFFRGYFPKDCVRLALFQQILFSLAPYKHKDNKWYLIISILMSLVLSPIIVIQVIISWTKSSKMLKEGNMIEWLK